MRTGAAENGGCECRRCETREWRYNENDVIIPGLWRYGDWRHVATGCTAVVLADGRWCSAFRKVTVGLALHWRKVFRVTYSVLKWIASKIIQCQLYIENRKRNVGISDRASVDDVDAKLFISAGIDAACFCWNLRSLCHIIYLFEKNSD